MLSPEKTLALRFVFNGCTAAIIQEEYVEPLYQTSPSPPLNNTQFRTYIDQILDTAIDHVETYFSHHVVYKMIMMRNRWNLGCTEADVHAFLSTEQPFHLIRTDKWMRQGLKNFLLRHYGIKEGTDFLA